MITSLKTLLVISLVGNVVSGAVFWARHAARAATAQAIAESTSGRGLAVSSRSPSGAVASPASPAAVPLGAMELSLELKEKLIEEGYPNAVVRTMIAVLTEEKHGVYDLEAAVNKGSTPDLQQQLDRRIQQAKADMLRLTDLYQSMDKQRDRDYAARYGDLPLATVETIRKLEAAHRNTTDRQFAVELKTALTPAQIDDYLRFNSLLAKQIQLMLDTIDVDESTYGELLRAAVEREKSAAPDMVPVELAKHNAEVASVEVYRRVLGDEAFLKIVARFDSVVASADAVYQVAGLSPAARADLFLEAYRAKARSLEASRTGANRTAIAEAARTNYDTLVQRAALTPAQIAGFDQMLGAYLKRGDFGGSGGAIATRSW